MLSHMEEINPAGLSSEPAGRLARIATGGADQVTTVELTRFTVLPEHEEALLAARPAMLADFRADRAGFIDAMLVRLPGNEWLDLVSWRSAEDFAASRAKGANRPGIAAFFGAISQLVSSEQGSLAGGGDRS